MKKLLRNLLLFPTLFTSIFSGYGKIIVALPIITIITKASSSPKTQTMSQQKSCWSE